MKVGSLFTGGGLGDYGFVLAGYEIVFQVEIDDYCQKILKLRWPDVPKWKDLRDVKGKDLPYCDILSGGFPCQDLSIANPKGEGLNGARSGLWKEYHRLICEIRPRWVLVENVSALLVRGLGTVLSDLASAGYDTEWACIPASAVGAPHRRDRVWILAYSMCGGRGSEFRKQQKERTKIVNSGGKRELADTYGQRKLQSEGSVKNVGERISDCCEDVADTDSLRMERPWPELKATRACGKGKTISDAQSTRQPRCFTRQGKIELRRSYTRNRECDGGIWTAEPNVGRVANGVADRVERLKLLGNGQVAQCVQFIAEQIMKYEQGRVR